MIPTKSAPRRKVAPLGVGELLSIPEDRRNQEETIPKLTVFETAGELSDSPMVALNGKEDDVIHLIEGGKAALKWGDGSILVMLPDGNLQAVVKGKFSSAARDFARRHKTDVETYRLLWLEGSCEEQFLDSLLLGLHGMAVRVYAEANLVKAIENIMKKDSTRFHREVIPNGEITGQTTNTVVEIVPAKAKWTEYAGWQVYVAVRAADSSSFESFYNSLGMGDDKSLGVWKRSSRYEMECLLVREGFLVTWQVTQESPVKDYVYFVHRTSDWPNKRWNEQAAAARDLMSHIGTDARHDKMIFIGFGPPDPQKQLEPVSFCLYLASLVQHGTPSVPETTAMMFSDWIG
eukprot:GHVS01083902.1.p1 GENE.GHVS01083902.1~~GHVS01083902.1.p1  ORF type:complete len:347 (+),score=46.54 GHVS01083902.1:2-1042(+)